jgi:hypothetical protein
MLTSRSTTAASSAAYALARDGCPATTARSAPRRARAACELRVGCDDHDATVRPAAPARTHSRLRARFCLSCLPSTHASVHCECACARSAHGRGRGCLLLVLHACYTCATRVLHVCFRLSCHRQAGRLATGGRATGRAPGGKYFVWRAGSDTNASRSLYSRATIE